jgi:phosphatidylserine decarboxylase
MSAAKAAGRAAGMGDRLFVALQAALPTRALSRLALAVAEVRTAHFKNALIRWFVRRYRVELSEAQWPQIECYEHFNAFFTRALKPGARPQPQDPRIFSSPVDGRISQLGPIHAGSLVQAKGHRYHLGELLGNPQLAAEFREGSFATLYLAPRDYHRVHMPAGGRLRRWAYVPGRLFSVNPATVRARPRLFARNERMVAIFDCEFGPLAMVMVGALFVGGIELAWHGRLTPPHPRQALPSFYEPSSPLFLPRGAEVGRFHLGSTVIVVAPAGALVWRAGLAPGQAVRLGEPLATIQPCPPTPAAI